jgi:hypothetical protein
MPDWIDKLAEKDKVLAGGRKTQEELRLHKARVISAKAQEFYDALIERLRSDSSKLRETFQDNRSRQCDVVTNGIDWEIRGCKLPWRVINMRLNIAGQIVDIAESKRETRDRVVPDGRDQIKITVNGDEELEFMYRGQTHLTPDSLAQALIERACGNLAFDAA